MPIVRVTRILKVPGFGPSITQSVTLLFHQESYRHVRNTTLFVFILAF